MIYPFYNPDQAGKRESRLSVAVSFYPIYEIVNRVGGEDVYLKQIIPFGTEPHSFEPTPRDMMEIGNSQLFIYNGLIDPWAKSIADSFPREKSNINLSKYVDIDNNDPHYWLNLENYKKMIVTITEMMSQLNPENSEKFNANAKRFIDEVNSLNTKYQDGLKECKFDTIIVNHNAFGYLSREYNFNTVAIMGLSPDEKPSAKKVAEIIDTIKERSVKTIFFEELASDSVIQSISSETGAKVSSLSPLGNIDPEDIDSGFIKLMEINLERLREALDCQ